MVEVIRGRAAERRAALEAELARITPVLRELPGVEAAWVFGSVASGQVHGGSDLDLFVVRRTDEVPIDRALTLQRELGPLISVDLFVYTPTELSNGGQLVDQAAAGRRLW